MLAGVERTILIHVIVDAKDESEYAARRAQVAALVDHGSIRDSFDAAGIEIKSVYVPERLVLGGEEPGVGKGRVRGTDTCAACGAPMDVQSGGCSDSNCSGFRGWRP